MPSCVTGRMFSNLIIINTFLGMCELFDFQLEWIFKRFVTYQNTIIINYQFLKYIKIICIFHKSNRNKKYEMILFIVIYIIYNILKFLTVGMCNHL